MDLQFVGIESVLVGFVSFFFLVNKFDYVINFQNGDGSFGGKFEGFDFGYCGF